MRPGLTVPALALRPYQEEALAAIAAAEARGVRRQLVALPTGTGKTVVFAHLIGRRPGRALVLVHRDELLGQAADKIQLVDPSAAIELGVVKAARDETGARIVLASVQTLARDRRLHRLVPDFRTVVVDEAHHAAAASYRRILDHVGSFAGGGPLTVGVTATQTAVGKSLTERGYESFRVNGGARPRAWRGLGPIGEPNQAGFGGGTRSEGGTRWDADSDIAAEKNEPRELSRKMRPNASQGETRPSPNADDEVEL